PESLYDPQRSRLRNWSRRRAHELRVEADLLRWHLTGKGQITWPGMGEPFNGQKARTEAIRAIVDVFRPDLFLETGTFLGHTTELLAGYGKPVHTAELKRSFAAVARRRLRRSPNVRVHRRPSLEVIRGLPRDSQRLFAYLDAHWWSDDPPLAREVAELAAGWPELVVVIDDFQVPGDPGYVFDTWGGRAFDESLLQLPEGVGAAYPAAPSEQE